MTFTEFCDQHEEEFAAAQPITVDEVGNFRNGDDIRKGQHAFNLLRRVRADLAEKVSGTERDPFYRDQNMPAFWNFIAREW